jgi:PhnB protein
MKLEPYVFFNGRCDEAIAFYKEALGAEVTFLMRTNESPDPIPPGALPAGFENKVMHATLNIGGNVIMPLGKTFYVD